MAEFNISFAEDSLDVEFNVDDNDLLVEEAIENVVLTDIESHNELDGRNDDNCHPISAITNLQTVLNGQNDAIVEHVQNPEVHVSSQEKEFWNNKMRTFRNASGALVFTIN